MTSHKNNWDKKWDTVIWVRDILISNSFFLNDVL